MESCKKWLRTFFYVKNASKEDLIGLPVFKIGPPLEKHNCELNPKKKYAEINLINDTVKYLMDDGMVAEDLLATYISRRISPLQHRSHKICHMSGRHDPNRITTVDLNHDQILKRIKVVAQMAVTENWDWGKGPYHQNHLPPPVSL